MENISVIIRSSTFDPYSHNRNNKLINEIENGYITYSHSGFIAHQTKDFIYILTINFDFMDVDSLLIYIDEQWITGILVATTTLNQLKRQIHSSFKNWYSPYDQFGKLAIVKIKYTKRVFRKVTIVNQVKFV